MSSVQSSWKGTDEHFIEAHGEFRKSSSESMHITRALQTYLPPAMENICESVQSNHGINILGIGSGDGSIDIEIIKIIYNELKRKYSSLNPIKMFNRAIEPQENHLSLYKAKTESLTRELSQAKLVFDIESPKTFDDYVAEVKDPVPFHIVHFIHSAYFFDDLESALTHCYNHELASHGMIALVVSEEDTVMEQVIRQARELPKEQRDIGREVARVACKYGWRYEVHTTEFTNDVTAVFDEQSREGNLLLDFYTYTMNFRANSRPETMDAILETLKNNSFNSEKKILAKVVNNVYFIFKN